METENKRYSILISYCIGAPIGLITIIFAFTIPVMVSGEGLATAALILIYGKAILGLVISFLVALWFGGKNAYTDLSNGKSLLNSSFRYTLRINLVIWTTFIVITLLDNLNEFSKIYIIIPIVTFILCILFTPITVGLLICYFIKRKLDYTFKHNFSID